MRVRKDKIYYTKSLASGKCYKMYYNPRAYCWMWVNSRDREYPMKGDDYITIGGYEKLITEEEYIEYLTILELKK